MIRFNHAHKIDRTGWPITGAFQRFLSLNDAHALADICDRTEAARIGLIDMLDAANADRAALREALRKRAVFNVDYGNTKPRHGACDVCNSEWPEGQPERHSAVDGAPCPCAIPERER